MPKDLVVCAIALIFSNYQHLDTDAGEEDLFADFGCCGGVVRKTREVVKASP
ncbi:hypothetical protein [Fischerella major]|uniref:hypothetical protein n=1 Tax=Fischerella major TaxID=210993 RepID=UPI000AEC7CC6|nr:hypothetical protein [Fischerella major]